MDALESLPKEVQKIINRHVRKWTRYQAARRIESDLVAAGIEGYVEALAGHQPAQGPIEAYAAPFIKGAIIREGGRHLFPFLSEDDFLKRPQVQKAVEVLLQKSRDITVEAVSKQSGLPPQQVGRILNPPRVCSLDRRADQAHLEPVAEQSTDLLAIERNSELLASVLNEAGLDHMELFVFADVLGWPMAEETLSFDKVGRRLGVSGETVRLRFDSAKKKVWAALSKSSHR